jgi:DnaJ like chaperone protein
MRENHPDTLASRGVPPHFVEQATRRVSEFNAAWNRIKKERGI